MYICVCNAVTDCQIRQAYCEGVCSLRALRESLGVAGCCGRCANSARDVLGQCRATAAQQQNRPPEYEQAPSEPVATSEA